MGLLGERILRHIVEHDSLPDVLAAGISAQHFEGSAQTAWHYTTRVARAEHRRPTAEELDSLCSTSVLTAEVDAEALPYLIKSAKAKLVTHTAAPVVADALEAFKRRRPEEALELLAGLLPLREQLREDIGDLHSFRADAAMRYEHYTLSKDKSRRGIPAMWPTFNDAVGGWINGLFYNIVAETQTGKSWFLAVLADHFSKQLAKDEDVVVFSTEMDVMRFTRRIDCVKYGLRFIDLRDGALDEGEELRWLSELEAAESGVSEYGDIKVVGKRRAKTVDDCIAIAQQYNTRAILVDGAYRLVANKDGEWSTQVKIIERLQEAVEEVVVPWITTTQMNPAKETRGKGGETSERRWDVRYAREWLINPDVVIRLKQDEDHLILNLMEVILEKIRDGDAPQVSYKIHWDKRTLNYDEYMPAAKSEPVEIPE